MRAAAYDGASAGVVAAGVQSALAESAASGALAAAITDEIAARDGSSPLLSASVAVAVATSAPSPSPSTPPSPTTIRSGSGGGGSARAESPNLVLLVALAWVVGACGLGCALCWRRFNRESDAANRKELESEEAGVAVQVAA